MDAAKGPMWPQLPRAVSLLCPCLTLVAAEFAIPAVGLEVSYPFARWDTEAQKE